MSRASPQLRNFARRLIIYEAGGKSAKIKAPDAFRVCDKLRPQLATLMGNGGFRALLSRALALASADVPWLCAMQVKSDGTLGGWEDLPAHVDSDKFFEGRVILLAQLLGLLVAFIGEKLTLRLMREVWPKAPLNGLDLIKGDKNEKTK
jgi:hypothetical protein